MGGNPQAQFGYVKFKVNKNTQVQTDVTRQFEFRRKIWVGDTNLEVVIEMLTSD